MYNLCLITYPLLVVVVAGEHSVLGLGEAPTCPRHQTRYLLTIPSRGRYRPHRYCQSRYER